MTEDWEKDAELLEAWRRGDTQAGERLFHRHANAVALFFDNKISCGAEDLVQATFLRLVESRERVRKWNLFASSDATLSNLTISYDVADVRITLADVALGYLTPQGGGPSLHTVEEGDAFFWVIGTDPDDPTTTEYVLAVNSTDIVATRNSGTGVWSVAAFDIEHIDFNSDAWTISIPSSTWDE